MAVGRDLRDSTQAIKSAVAYRTARPIRTHGSWPERFRLKSVLGLTASIVAAVCAG